jgi:hypothetical protein
MEELEGRRILPRKNRTLPLEIFCSFFSLSPLSVCSEYWSCIDLRESGSRAGIILRGATSTSLTLLFFPFLTDFVSCWIYGMGSSVPAVSIL